MLEFLPPAGADYEFDCDIKNGIRLSLLDEVIV